MKKAEIDQIVKRDEATLLFLKRILNREIGLFKSRKGVLLDEIQAMQEQITDCDQYIKEYQDDLNRLEKV